MYKPGMLNDSNIISERKKKTINNSSSGTNLLEIPFELPNKKLTFLCQHFPRKDQQVFPQYSGNTPISRKMTRVTKNID